MRTTSILGLDPLRLGLGLGLSLGLGVTTGAGCLRIDPFECQRDADCVHDGLGGTCLLTQGTCVYLDPACPSTGYSTAEGRCVLGPPPSSNDGKGSGGPGSTSSPSGPHTSEGDDSEGSTGGAPPDTGDEGPPATTGSSSCAGPMDDITAQGVVEASSVYNDDFHAYLAVDSNYGSSWFSSGPEPGGLPSLFTWTVLEPHCISEIHFTGNGLHQNPAYREDFGFGSMVVRVYDGSDTLLFQQMLALPGTPDPPVVAYPDVEGVKVELELFDHESNDCGGFSELEIIGD